MTLELMSWLAVVSGMQFTGNLFVDLQFLDKQFRRVAELNSQSQDRQDQRLKNDF